MRLLFVVLVAVAFGGCSDPFYPKEFTGQVVRSPVSRMKFTSSDKGTSGEEKFSLVLKPTGALNDVIREVACGPSGCALECISTRCAALEPGSCHAFDCKHEVRWTEPDVISCKHARELACP